MPTEQQSTSEPERDPSELKNTRLQGYLGIMAPAMADAYRHSRWQRV